MNLVREARSWAKDDTLPQDVQALLLALALEVEDLTEIAMIYTDNQRTTL